MIAPLLMTLLALLPATCSSDVDWTTVRAVRVAAVDGRQHLDASADDVDALPTTPVNVAWFRDILSRAAPAPTDELFLWKGGVLVLADLAEGTQRLAASAYGGYVLVGDVRDVWRVDAADLAEWERLVLGRSLPDDASPATILRAMQHAYAFCSSYQDRGEVVSSIGDGGRIPDIEQHKVFTTAYVRPDHLRFEYAQPMVLGAVRHVIWTREGKVRAWWSLGDMPKSVSLVTAFAAAAGVSGGASITVPNLLLPQLPDPSILALQDTVRLENARVGEHDCYRLAGTHSEQHVTLSIDVATLLLVRIDRDGVLEGNHGEQRPYTNVVTYEATFDEPVPPEALEYDVP